ncbi:MAG: MFS transporter [Coriobacteriia bacterium]
MSAQESPEEYPIQPPSDALTAEADAAVPPRGLPRLGRTFESFRHRDFSYAFAGALISNIGSWMQLMALGWVVFDLTGSSQSLGFMNAMAGLPVTFLSVFAGVVSDRVDRRKLLIVVQAFLMAQALAFGILNQTGHITMWWIYTLSLGGGFASAFMSPAWQAMTPDLVPRESLMNAIALNSAQFNAARLVGPMVGGLVFAVLGVTEVFYVNAASFLFVIWALAVIRPQQKKHVRGSESVRSVMLGGLRYARDHSRVAWLLISAAVLTVFGMPFTALLPALAKSTLGLNETGYSVLMAANGAGALTSALVVATLARTIRREWIIRWGYLVMGLGVIGLGLSRSVPLSIALLVIIGAAFLAIVSSINTSLQMSVPGEIRGRVMSLFVLAFMGMTPVGSAIFGSLGQRIGAPTAIVSGGGVVIVFGIVLLLRPGLLCEDGGRC